MQRYGVDVLRELSDDSVELVELSDLTAFLGIDFTDSDTMLTNFISRARNAVETYCGISIIRQTITLTAECWDGAYLLPYGPVVSVTSLTDLEEVEVDYTSFGSHNKTIDISAPNGCIIIYEAGGSCSEDAKQLILMMAAVMYDKELFVVYKAEIEALKRQLRKHQI